MPDHSGIAAGHLVTTGRRANMDNQSYPAAGNIIPLALKPRGARSSAPNSPACRSRPKLKGKNAAGDGRPAGTKAGSKDDPRMKQALTLMEAFLAIDDEAARSALVTRAQQLVSHDWARRARRL